jgi:hypothetical protein
MAVPSPRDYDPFYASIAGIDYVDIYLEKYSEVLTAMQNIKEFFLSRDYDYLIICQDDYEVPLLAPLKIMMDVEYFHYPVVCGWCQIGSNRQISNVGNLPLRVYEDAMDRRIPHLVDYLYPVKNITQFMLDKVQFLPITFTGHTLCAISRDVVKIWSPKAWFFHKFANQRSFVENDGVVGCWEGIDNWFSYEMTKRGIPMVADLGVFVPHDAPDYDNLLVGKKEPKAEFYPSATSTLFHQPQS